MSDGRATVGVLPLPGGEGVDPWWRNLARDGEAVPRIVARLPFAAAASPGADRPEALAISLAVSEATGADRAFLVVETAQLVSRSHLKGTLAEAGFEALDIQIAEEESERALNFVEVEGYVARDDPRLERLRDAGTDTLSQVWAVGGFAVPLELDDPAPPGGEGGGR